MNFRAIVVAAVVGLGGLPAVAAGAALHETPALRSIEVRDLRLRAGESVGFAFHPSVRPAELQVSQPGFEVCPATTDGLIDLTDGSWPSASGFETCRPTEASRRVQVPSTTIPTFHVGFSLRTRDGRAAKNVRISIDYEEVDGFFLYFPPPLRPGARSARLIQDAPPNPKAAACAYVMPRFTRASDVRVVVTQDGDRVSVPCNGASIEPATSTDIRAGRPVSASLRNVGPRVIEVALDLRFV